MRKRGEKRKERRYKERIVKEYSVKSKLHTSGTLMHSEKEKKKRKGREREGK